MPEPLSPRNAEVARLRALARDRRARHEAGRFVVEGHKLVGEALASDVTVYDVYVADGWDPPPSLAAAISAADIDVTVVSERGIERIASTSSPQPVVAEALMQPSTYDDLPELPSVLVGIDLNDPGNVGTLARSAVAAGFDAVVCLGDTADPFAPKVIRAAAGALFKVPVIIDRDPLVGLQELGRRGIKRFGTRMAEATACDEAELTRSLALVLGSEAHGLGADQEAEIDAWLSVPMPGDTESLNVAMAGTILTYEVARQRRADRR